MGHKLIKVYLYSVILLILGFVVSVSSYLVIPSASADKSSIDNLTIELPIACTLSSTNNTHIEVLTNNTYDDNIGNAASTFTTYCNDKGGYVIYAVGSSNNTEGNTNLVGNNGNNIATGIYTSGNTNSSWSFKLAAEDNTLTMNSKYNNTFAAIPSGWDWVAKKESGTADSINGSTITATYDTYINGIQAAGTYTGQVKYVMFHPSTHPQPTTINESFANNGKTKIQATDPLTGESGEFYTMQDMNTTICNETSVFGIASEAILVDTRDSKLYYVAKLEDGHCWMTENLDLDLETTPNKVAALASNNTNLKLYGSRGYDSNNGYSCSNDSPTCENGVITWTPEASTSTDLNDWASDKNNPYSYDRGLYAPNGEMDGHGYTGNYYNWTAAIASNNSSSYSSVYGGNTISSICPKGWRLPIVKSGEFSNLLYLYNVIRNNTTSNNSYTDGGLNRIISSPLYFVRSGYISDKGSLSYSGSQGFYQSSSFYSSSTAFNLSFAERSISTAFYSYSRSYSFSLRCLAE